MTKEQIDRNFHRLYTLVGPIFRLLYPLKVVGRENIPQGPVVICPNHTYWNDPFCIVFAFGREFIMRAMAKAEILAWPVVGPILGKSGVFGVDRGNTDMKAARNAMKALREGTKLLIFPEGTRVQEGESVEAKAGAALFATRCNVPILPVYIKNAKKPFKTTTVVIGQPYMPRYEGRKASSEELQNIARDVQQRIYGLEEAIR